MKRPCDKCGEYFEKTGKGDKLCGRCYDLTHKYRDFKAKQSYFATCSKCDQKINRNNQGRIVLQRYINRGHQNKRVMNIGSLCLSCWNKLKVSLLAKETKHLNT